MTKAKTPREPQSSDLLTTSDIADLYGWDVPRADALMRALVADGVKVVRIAGMRRRFVRRGDIESRMRETGDVL